MCGTIREVEKVEKECVSLFFFGAETRSGFLLRPNRLHLSLRNMMVQSPFSVR
jgi:hypothetical protein